MIAVFIPGDPTTQGSIAFKGMRGNRAILTSDNPRLYKWRNHVRAHIIGSDGEPFERFEGPVHLDLEFVLSRPQSAPKKKDTKISADKRRSSDLDKLARAIFDAVSDAKKKGGRVIKGALKDDVQVVSVTASKRIAKIGETPGCHLHIACAIEHEQQEEKAA